MNILARKLVLQAAFFLPALLSYDVVRSQEVADPDQLPVDVMQVLELPAHVDNPILLRSETGYVLKCKISNNSDDRILGFTYQLLVLSSASELRIVPSQAAALKLSGYATKDLTLQLLGKLKLRSGDRVVMVVEQVIGRELVWEVLNSRAALEAYGRGDYLAPEVKQILNQVDSMPSPRALY